HNQNALDAVENGEVPFALINNYYWDRQVKEKGEDAMNSELHFFGTHDLGDLITVASAGILESSENKEEAQEFIDFMTSEEGQQILTDESSQYPLNPDVETEGLKPFSELTPTIDTRGRYSLMNMPAIDNQRKKGKKKRAPILLLLPVLLLVVLCLLPILYVVLRAQQAGWAQAIQLIFRERVYELLANTLKMDFS